MEEKETGNNNLKMFFCSILLCACLAIARTVIDSNFKIELKISAPLLLVIAFGLFLIEMIIHELGHCIVFAIHGINIKAVLFFLFAFINEDGRWKIKLCSWKQFFMGGMVVPQLPNIKSEEEYQKVRMIYARELLGGPIATIFFTIVGAAICFIIGRMEKSIKTECMLLAGLTLVFGIAILISTMKKSTSDLGDWKAYQLMKEDSLWSNNIIVNDETVQKPGIPAAQNSYAAARADRFLQSANLDITMIQFMTYILNKALAVEQYNLTVSQEKLLDSIQRNNGWMEHLEQEEYEIFGYRLVQYIMVCQKNYVHALELYKCILEKVRYKRAYYEYYTFQCEQALGIENHKDYLYDPRRIKTSSDWKIWSVLKEYYQEEEKINSRLCSGEVL